MELQAAPFSAGGAVAISRAGNTVKTCARKRQRQRGERTYRGKVETQLPRIEIGKSTFTARAFHWLVSGALKTSAAQCADIAAEPRLVNGSRFQIRDSRSGYGTVYRCLTNAKQIRETGAPLNLVVSLLSDTNRKTANLTGSPRRYRRHRSQWTTALQILRFSAPSVEF